MSGENRLRTAIARLRGPDGHPQGGADGRPQGGAPTHCGAPLRPEPTSAFEVAVAEQIRAIRADIDRLESRLTWLFTLIIGAAVTNLILALVR